MKSALRHLEASLENTINRHLELFKKIPFAPLKLKINEAWVQETGRENDATYELLKKSFYIPNYT